MEDRLGGGRGSSAGGSPSPFEKTGSVYRALWDAAVRFTYRAAATAAGGALRSRISTPLLPHENADTLFLYCMRTSYPELWQRAFDSAAIICVPQSVSLGHDHDIGDMETHVLVPSKIPGEYSTLNGKKVKIAGNELCTEDGFAERRRVRVLVTEDICCGTEANRTTVALHISRPLVGGTDAPDETDEMTRTTIKRYIAILRSHPELEAVFRDMDSFIREVNFVGERSEDGFKRIQPSLGQCIRAQWERCVSTVVNSGCFADVRGASNWRHREQVALVIECYLMEGVHRTVYPWLQQQWAEADILLSNVLHRMRYHTQADIGMRAEFQCDLTDAVQEFIGMADCVTPLEKLLCLKRTATVINRAVESNLDMHYREAGDFQLTTDDLLDEVLYVLLQAYPHSQNLLSDLRYIKAFHFPNVSLSGLGYNLANFEVAADWFMMKDEGRLRDMEREAISAFEEGQEALDPLFRNLGRVLPAMSDAACAANARFETEVQMGECSGGGTSDVLNELPAEMRSAVLAEFRRQRGVDSDSDGGRPEQPGADSRAQAVSAPNESATAPAPSVSAGPSEVVVYGDSAVRQSGDQAQTQVIISDDDGIDRQVKVQDVACGQQFFAAVADNGELYTWGLAEGGRLGHGPDLDTFFPIQKPRLVAALRADVVTTVSCGTYHMLAVVETGDVFAWGDNRSGQLGLGQQEGGTAGSNARPAVQFNPARVEGLAAAGVKVKAVACGSQHSLALSDDGRVFAWGRAQAGRLGLGDEYGAGDQGLPRLVKTDWKKRALDPSAPVGSALYTPDDTYLRESATCVVNIAAGWSHSLAVSEDGAVFSWGCGVEGRLGHGSHADERFPKQLRALAAPEISITACAAGYGHSVFLSSSGAAYACGYNKFGQVGTSPWPCHGGGTAVHSSAPADAAGHYGWQGLTPEESRHTSDKDSHVVLVPQRILVGLRGLHIRDVSCGENHTAVLTQTQKVFTWGLNLGNQCAHGGAVEKKDVPTEVALLAGVKLLSCGAAHTMVVVG